MRRVASSSMKKFTVDPVPTPSTSPGTTYSSAARAAACFPVFCELFTSRTLRVSNPENDDARLRGHRLRIWRRVREDSHSPVLPRPELFLLGFLLGLLLGFRHGTSPVVTG